MAKVLELITLNNEKYKCEKAVPITDVACIAAGIDTIFKDLPDFNWHHDDFHNEYLKERGTVKQIYKRIFRPERTLRELGFKGIHKLNIYVPFYNDDDFEQFLDLRLEELFELKLRLDKYQRILNQQLNVELLEYQIVDKDELYLKLEGLEKFIKSIKSINVTPVNETWIIEANVIGKPGAPITPEGKLEYIARDEILTDDKLFLLTALCAISFGTIKGIKKGFFENPETIISHFKHKGNNKPKFTSSGTLEKALYWYEGFIDEEKTLEHRPSPKSVRAISFWMTELLTGREANRPHPALRNIPEEDRDDVLMSMVKDLNQRFSAFDDEVIEESCDDILEMTAYIA